MDERSETQICYVSDLVSSGAGAGAAAAGAGGCSAVGFGFGMLLAAPPCARHGPIRPTGLQPLRRAPASGCLCYLMSHL